MKKIVAAVYFLLLIYANGFSQKTVECNVKRILYQDGVIKDSFIQQSILYKGGKIISKIEYLQDGTVESQEKYYYEKDKLTKEVFLQKEKENETEYIYNSKEELIEKREKNNGKTVSTYKYKYANGNQVFRGDYNLADNKMKLESYEISLYDAKNRVICENILSSGFLINSSTTYIYNDKKNVTTCYSYNSEGELILHYDIIVSDQTIEKIYYRNDSVSMSTKEKYNNEGKLLASETKRSSGELLSDEYYEYLDNGNIKIHRVNNLIEKSTTITRFSDSRIQSEEDYYQNNLIEKRIYIYVNK